MDQSAALALKIAARSSSLHRRLLPAPFRNGIMGSSRKPSDLAEAFLSVGDSSWVAETAIPNRFQQCLCVGRAGLDSVAANLSHLRGAEDPTMPRALGLRDEHARPGPAPGGAMSRDRIALPTNGGDRTFG